ncbi:MAG: class I SAM-dependent methyltransferase [Bacteroidia bacterium]|nr:class I SAM-dependent methyltransferase [Bacteroidia bacterium]
MPNSYNFIANYYGFLSSSMFGNSILNIQENLIKHLPNQGTLLILGGGDGSILPLIFEHAPDIQIEYLEASNTMIELAKKKVSISQKITFNHNANFTTQLVSYDYVFCGFFFDQFEESKIAQIIQKIDSVKTRWMVADFCLNEVTKYRVWRMLQIKLSILFFKITARHSINYLPEVFETFYRDGFKSKHTSTLSHGFYRSQVFHR